MRVLAIRSVLAASDLGDASDEVVRAAGALAARTGAKLHVVHAFDARRTPATSAAGQPVTFRGLIDDVERALDEQIRRTVPEKVKVASRRVVEDAPAQAILAYASEIAADLLVLGPHTHRRAGDWLLGGTADRVVRTVSAPCLVVRGSLRVPLRRVVAPLDVAEPVREALDLVLAWTGALGVRPSPDPIPEMQLRVLHVLPPVMRSDSFALDHAVVGPGLRGTIQAAVDRVPGATMLDVHEEVLWGDDPAEEIIGFARREAADLLVLAARGYGPARRALLGSVSSAVASGASCSVLLLPPALWRAEPGPALAGSGAWPRPAPA